MISEQDIEKIIYRAIEKTWHTSKGKQGNVKAASIVASVEVFNVMQQYILCPFPLKEIIALEEQIRAEYPRDYQKLTRWQMVNRLLNPPAQS